MKESSGELSMTVVVIVAAVILIAILRMLLPSMSNFISEKWQNMTHAADKDGTAVIVAPVEDIFE